MTNKEAIEFLKNMIDEKTISAIDKEGFFAELMGYHVEALKLAIKALKNEPKKGKWETVTELLNERESKLDIVKCPFCETTKQGRTRFCSWCGADMREAEE